MRNSMMLACLFSGLSLTTLAAPSQHDQYYSDDIFTAIEEAKQRTHHYNYSRAKRYNRTTSQSIQIPRLLNTEMDEHIVKGAIQPSASGNDTNNYTSTNNYTHTDKEKYNHEQQQANQKVTRANLGQTLTKDETLDSPPETGLVDTLKVESSTSNIIREISYSGQDYTGSAKNISADVSISASTRP